MAIYLRNDQSASTTSASSVTISSYDSTSGVERPDTVLVVGVGIRNASTAPTIDSVTFGGTGLTKSDGIIHTVSGNDVRSEIWYLANPSGTGDVVANLSASASDLNIVAVILDGAVEQADEASNTATDATPTTTGPHSVTTVTDGAMIVDFYAQGGENQVATTSETGQTKLASEPTSSGNQRCAMTYRQAGDAGSHTMGITLSGVPTEMAHTLTAWEDAGAWISNFVSALTQGNEDFDNVTNAAQISQVTSPLPSADWGRVFQFTGNASQGALEASPWADNHSEPTANHVIHGVILRWSDVSPATEYEFIRGRSIGSTGWTLILETDGDIRLEDGAGSTVATATTPISVDTYYIFEIRILPSGSVGEIQVWYKEFGTGSFSDLFGGNQTGLDTGTNYGQTIQFTIQGPTASSGNMFFAGWYGMINSVAASDRLDSDFEVIGPYQSDETFSPVGTPDNGDALDSFVTTNGWQDTQETPFADEADSRANGYDGSNLAGSIHTDGGARAGPSGDSRVDGDSNIKAWRSIWRGRRGNGSSTVWTIYIGDDSGTWTSGFDSYTPTIDSSVSNFYFCTDDSTNMPASGDNFSFGFGKDGGGRTIWCQEMAAFVLHVPAAAAGLPNLVMAPRIPT